MISSLRTRITNTILSIVILIGCAGIAATVAFVDAATNPTVAHAGEWRYGSGGWWLQTNNGYATGWKQINGTWYYFDRNGWMKTGWQQIGGDWFYFNANGAMATGWQWIGGKWYYLDNTGVMQTHWQSIGGKWYYFNEDGAMQTGWVPHWKDTWCYFDNNGTPVTGWNKIGSKWYYFNTSGEMLIGWQYINGKWYHLNGSGAMDANKWIGNYYVKSDGSMAINQWVGKYYVEGNGLWDGAKTNLNPLHIETDFYEFDLPESWKGKVSYKTENSCTRVFLTSYDSFANNNFDLLRISASSIENLDYHQNEYSIKTLGKTPSGATVYLTIIDSVCSSSLTWGQANNGAITWNSVYDDLFSKSIELQTGGKLTLNQIKENPKLLLYSTAVEDYIYQEIVPTIKLHN